MTTSLRGDDVAERAASALALARGPPAPVPTLYLKALAELRRSLAETSPDEDHGGHLGSWNDVRHRTRADAVRLYDVTIARVAAAA